MAKVKRRVNQQNILNPNDITAISFNERSGSLKTLSVGPEFAKSGSGGITPIDASASNILLPKGTIIALYNNSSSLAWINMNVAPNTLAAPGPSNGIPLQPNNWTYLSLGENDQIRTSSPNVLIYIVADETFVQTVNIDSSF